MYDTREKIHHPQSYMWGRKKRKAGGWSGVGEGTAGAKRKTERENEKLERETELIVIAVALRGDCRHHHHHQHHHRSVYKKKSFFFFFSFSPPLFPVGEMPISLSLSLSSHRIPAVIISIQLD